MCTVPKREQDGWMWWHASNLLCPLQVGNTPLHLAAMTNHTDYVKPLLSTPGVDVNIKNNVSRYNGYSTLVCCISIGVPKREQDGWVCWCAIKLFCPIQVGNTPLLLAAMKNHTNYVKHLLSTPGIDVHIKNNVSRYSGY